MNWFSYYKFAAKIPIKMEVECTGYYSGQTDLIIRAKLETGECIGYITFTEFQGEISVKNTNTLKEYQRNGIATDMMHYLQELYPDKEIRWGYFTDEGAKTYDSLSKRREPNQKAISIKEEYRGLKEKIKELEEYFEKHVGPVSANKDSIAKGELLQEMYNREWEIEHTDEFTQNDFKEYLNFAKNK